MSVETFYTLTVGIPFLAAVALLAYLIARRRSRSAHMGSNEYDDIEGPG